MTEFTLNNLIERLVHQPIKATPAELTQLVAGAGVAPFAAELLEVDEPLWGGFWHFDVLSPGYRLPAVELALLRAIRLDQHWPAETGPEQFLADLRQAIQHPQAGIWTLPLAEVFWAVFAAPSPEDSPELDEGLLTVAWYCAATDRLHAGYRAAFSALHLAQDQAQRPLRLRPAKPSHPTQPGWLGPVVEQLDLVEPAGQAARLDREILRWRLQEGG